MFRPSIKFKQLTLSIIARRLKSSAQHQPLRSSFVPSPIVFVAGLAVAAVGGYYCLDSRSAIHEYVLCPLIRTSQMQSWDISWGFFHEVWIVPRLLDDGKNDQSDVLGVQVFGHKLKNQ